MNPRGKPADQDLQAYNSLVLQNQDEAFSLAFDLLGDESAADAAVQQAFMHGFARQVDARLPFRLWVLRWVVSACLERSQILPGPARLEPRLAFLSNEDNVALVLVERLGLSYSQAAGVAQKSEAEFRKQLAAARFSLCKMS